MGKNKDQGTWWETHTVNRLKEAGRFARRLEEGGNQDLGDVYVEGHFGDEDEKPKVALAWRRFLPTKGKRRRTQQVVVLDYDDFLELVTHSIHQWVIECKATEALSVTTALAKAQAKVDDNWEGYRFGDNL